MVKETVGMESLGENLKPTSQQEGTEFEFAWYSRDASTCRFQ